MPEIEAMSVVASPAPAEQPRNQTEVFAVHGADPEVLAYAMAKYSRSALSMRDSLREISSQRAEQFLNTFYFQYGHRSIADLAHLAFAIERLSLLAAIVLVDEQRWDGQERSTRYQNFRKSGWYMPDFGADQASAALFRENIEALFGAYHEVAQGVLESLKDSIAKPGEMKQESYERTLRARAFDIARYLLPLATNTSLGQIVNARTLETQVARLLAHTHGEVRQLGELLKQAARTPAYDVGHHRMEKVLADVRAVSEELADKIAPELLREVRVSPTLVKYAEPNKYEMESRKELAQAAAELMKGAAIEKVSAVTLVPETKAAGDALEIEIATTLLYAQCHYPYVQVRAAVEALSAAQRSELVALGTKHRGRHDELPRAFCAGQRFRFDILMDVGGFRDMHRHRRCVQVMQGYTTAHGYDVPADVIEAGEEKRYHETMKRAEQAMAKLSAAKDVTEAAVNAQYLLPLAYRRRCLFSMDLAEVVYICEIRTTPAGHWSYREVAYAMYEEVVKRHPGLKHLFRVTDVREPVDLLKR